MEDNDMQESQFDLTTSRLLDNVAQRFSRRGVLARLGKLALGALGVSLLPNLPLDRTFVAEAQTGGCTDWRLCGIYGYVCQSCCNGTGSMTSCPSCTTRGSFWSSCCETLDGCSSKTVSYYDCCGGTDTETANCRGSHCLNNPEAQPAWCTSGAYRCTIAVVGSAC